MFDIHYWRDHDRAIPIGWFNIIGLGNYTSLPPLSANTYSEHHREETKKKGRIVPDLIPWNPRTCPTLLPLPSPSPPRRHRSVAPPLPIPPLSRLCLTPHRRDNIRTEGLLRWFSGAAAAVLGSRSFPAPSSSVSGICTTIRTEDPCSEIVDTA
jgi:hypothetical protein